MLKQYAALVLTGTENLITKEINHFCYQKKAIVLAIYILLDHFQYFIDMRNTSELIEQVIKLLDDNFLVYIQRADSKLVAIPEFDDYMDFMDVSDENYELLYNDIESNPADYFQIKKLTSRELYNTMMDFSLEQERSESIEMVKALRSKDPIKQFNLTVSKISSTALGSWNIYYNEQLKRIIRNRLCKERIHLHL